VADIVLMMENAYYSVITPEGCASILLRDSGRAREAAALLKLTPEDLLRFRVVDRIVSEPKVGAHKDAAGAAAALKAEPADVPVGPGTEERGVAPDAETPEVPQSWGVPGRRGAPQSLLQRLRDFF